MTSASPAADAPLVLISPAMAVRSSYYRPLVAAFDAVEWPARALPRRGFEADDAPASRRADWSYADEVAVLADAVDAARADEPRRRVLLLGHSLGGQLAAAQVLGPRPADGLVTIGASLPCWRDHGRAAPALLGLALAVPAVTRARGYWPRPGFGAPGARTMKREWAGLLRTGVPPFEVTDRARVPALLVQLDGDRLSPPAGLDRYAETLLRPELTTRWTYRRDATPSGGSVDHLRWVRTPEPVVDRVRAWWSDLAAGTRLSSRTQPG